MHNQKFKKKQIANLNKKDEYKKNKSKGKITDIQKVKLYFIDFICL